MDRRVRVLTRVYPRLMVAGWLLFLLLVGNVHVAYRLRRTRKGRPFHYPWTWLIIVPALSLWALTPVAWAWAAVYTPWALWKAHEGRLLVEHRQARQVVRSRGYASV